MSPPSDSRGNGTDPPEALGAADADAKASATAGSTVGAIQPCPSSALLDELEAAGVKFTRDKVIVTAKLPDGRLEEVKSRIVFLETGTAKAGLEHILGAHAQDFANAGIPEAQIPDAIMKAVTKGEEDGIQGKDRPIYKVDINGQEKRIAVTTGKNGFIVGANPASKKEF